MGYEVRGGPGSIKFSIAELERTTSMLSGAGAELLEGASMLLGASQFPAAMLALGTLMMRMRVLDAVRGVAEATAACTVCAGEAGALAANVATARLRYEQTESVLGHGMNAVRGSLLPLGLMWDLANNGGRPRTLTTEDLINQLPRFLGLPFGLLRDIEHGGVSDQPLADRLYPRLTDLLEGQNLLHLSPIEVLGEGQERIVKFDSNIESLVGLQKLAEHEPPGSLLVTQFDAPQGNVYVLTIPGTQADPLEKKAADLRLVGQGPRAGMANPWDGTGIVEAMGNDSRNLMPSIEDALRESGAKNGDRVVVTGYSQGGIHAVNIVKDEHLNGMFSFPYLCTFGSPTGRTPVPEDTHALHLEDEKDMVPGTDGTPNPDERNRLTVVFDGPDGTVELGNDGFGGPHKLENYESHAKELSGSRDPGVVESLGLLGTLVGRSKQGRVRSFQLGRRPRPKPKKPDKNDSQREGLDRIAPAH